MRRGLAADVPEPYRTVAGREIEPLGSRELSRLMRAAASFRVEPARVTAPVLVLWGEHDRANARLARALASGLRDATAREIPGAGHVANLDAPEAFTAEISAFVKISS